MSTIGRTSRTARAMTAALLACILSPAAWAADGLQTRTSLGLGDTPRWQARLSLSSLDPNTPAGMESQHQFGSRILSANLLGDYYLTGSGFGTVKGGLRATGGMLLGPLSQSQSGSGLALGASSLQGSPNLAIGQRSMSLLSPSRDLVDPSISQSYLGIGYTGQLVHTGVSFSADLGMIGGGTSLGGLRLGPSSAPGLDDVLRDVRYKPVVQFGLSYSY